jgi:hypothetical protein
LAGLIFFASAFPGIAELPNLRQSISPADQVYLEEIEQDTLKGVLKLMDPSTGWLVDIASIASGDVKKNYSNADFSKTSPTNIGLGMAAILAAMERGKVSEASARASIERMILTLESVERHQGFFYNWYGLTGREGQTPRRTLNHFISSVDNGNLSAALIVVAQAFKGTDLGDRAQKLLDGQNYNFFFNKNPHNAKTGLISHGYDTEKGVFSDYDYGILNTEARLMTLIAILKDSVPDSAWNNQNNLVKAYVTEDGKKIEHIASWSGSIFEALFASQFLGDGHLSPDGWAENGQRVIEIHMDRGSRISKAKVWGFSPSQIPGTGGQYEAAGIPEASYQRFEGKFVTPYSVLLALRYAPQNAVSALKAMLDLNPKVYDSDYGYTDSIDPESGIINENILGLDKGDGSYRCDECFDGAEWTTKNHLGIFSKLFA